MVHVSEAGGQVVTVHRITQPWTEMTVTWNSFVSAYDVTALGSFVATDTGWYSVDVTSTVDLWVNTSEGNYGLLLDQTQAAGSRTCYSSRESGETAPRLLIGYTIADSARSGTVHATQDAYIMSGHPDVTTGGDSVLYSGWLPEDGLEHQTLLQFHFKIAIPSAVIGDCVWHDMNADGIQDSSETGIAGVMVSLYRCDSSLVATTTTRDGGRYTFPDKRSTYRLMPGDYYVRVCAPSGYVFSPQNQGGDPQWDSDADPETGRTPCFSLGMAQRDLSRDAGLYQPEVGCTYSKGFWKNHGGLGPQEDLLSEHLPIRLGRADGEKSLLVDSARKAVDVLTMFTYGDPSNGITKLYAQLLAARLNIENGADGGAVVDALEEADLFLADHDWLDWEALGHANRVCILRWKDIFDDYNHGIIGPGHCGCHD
jgi:hypothetical protein